MIVKERDFPINIAKLEILLKRLPQNHPRFKDVEQELYRKTAGLKGEQNTDYPLSFLSPNHYFILHDLRLPVDHFYFQIDTLIISKNLLFIIEIKNIAGTLVFNHDFQQLIKIHEGIEETLPNPMIQVERQKFLLKKWLESKYHYDLPVETLIVFSNPQTILKTSQPVKNIPDNIIHRDSLPFKISKLEKMYENQRLTDKEIKRLIRHLKKDHTPRDFDVLKKFNIHPNDLIKGVFCPQCMQPSFKRIYGSWKCSICLQKDKLAHIDAVRDYFLLFGREITNIKLREFMNFDNIYVASRLLKKISEESIGKFKGKKHFISDELFRKLS